MPDISMCCNKLCDKRKSCHRYTATPNEYRQSYASFSGEECFMESYSGEVSEEFLEKRDQDVTHIFEYFERDVK